MVIKTVITYLLRLRLPQRRFMDGRVDLTSRPNAQTLVLICIVFDAPQQIVDRTAGTVASRHVYDEISGPFYDTPGLMRWLGITRQALHHKAARHMVLACPFADGDLVYPAWQFLPDGATIPGLAEVLTALGHRRRCVDGSVVDARPSRPSRWGAAKRMREDLSVVGETPGHLILGHTPVVAGS